MPYKNPLTVRGYIYPLILNNFSGGWNPREAPSEVADNESPNCMNVTMDERGGVVKRLGQTRLGSGAGLSAAPRNIFYWSSGGVTIVQDGAAVKTTVDFVSYTTIKTFSSSATAGFCDFQNKLVMVHPVDKVSVWDGAALTDVATSPRGAAITGWQNKVWVTADPANKARVYACAPGDPLTWDLVNDYVDVREKDGLSCTAIGAGQGMDISGRPGLLVFKDDSVHRINDSRSGTTFGAYTTLHNKAGAAGPLAISATPSGQVCFIGRRGIFASNGVDPPINVSSKLQPFFNDIELNFSQLSKWCAGNYKDRVVFSLTRGSSQITNNFTLEYSPNLGWIVPHSFGCSAFTEYLSSSRRLYGASPTAGKVFDVFTSGGDDGSSITAIWQSRWFEPAIGYELRLRRLRVSGRGDFNLYTKLDYNLGQGTLSEFAGEGSGDRWGFTTWGGGLWGAPLYETRRDFFSLGIAKSVSFELTETSSSSAVGPKLLEDGSSPEVGNFALYGITLDYVRLGYA